MSCTLVADVGSANANSFCTVLFGDAYFAVHTAPGEWATASTDQKCVALQAATRYISERMVWDGNVVNDTQALLWPRYGMFKRNGYTVPHTEIPVDLKEATCEVAKVLLDTENDLLDDNDVQVSGITSLTAGPVAITFGKKAVTMRLPDAALVKISHYGRPVRSSSNVRTTKLRRG